MEMDGGAATAADHAEFKLAVEQGTAAARFSVFGPAPAADGAAAADDEDAAAAAAAAEDAAAALIIFTSGTTGSGLAISRHIIRYKLNSRNEG
jgi:acyl-coenzyme A synthetase/AMP-(fatty) acid ligase